MKKNFAYAALLIVYGVILVKVMVLKDVPLIRVGQLMLNFGGQNAGHSPNFIPFKTILPYLLGSKGLLIGGVNIVVNIALLVPLGFLVVLIWQNISWKKSLILASLSGLIIEILQLVLKVGIFDIDDVILNALGFMIGYFMFRVFDKWASEGGFVKIFGSIVLIIAMSVGSFYYFIYPKDQPVINVGSNAEEVVGDTEKGTDPCGGTNGTGGITSKTSDTITIKRGDDKEETFKITTKTEIKNSKGDIKQSSLKVGDRVTIVTFEDDIANAVLVCGVI